MCKWCEGVKRAVGLQVVWWLCDVRLEMESIRPVLDQRVVSQWKWSVLESRAFYPSYIQVDGKATGAGTG